jgi:predicted DNA-binding transcriptional regulator YafY
MRADARFNRHTGCYELVEFSGLPGFDLSDEALAALAFLEDAFQPGAPHHEKVQALRNQLHACLPEDRRLELARRRVALRMDLRRLDPHPIDPRVENKVEQALVKRRLLRFNYRTPLYEDGQPRQHTVEPYELTFDTQRRHQYLYAYCRRMDGPDGEQTVQQYIYYRLDRILPEGVELLESKLAPQGPRAKRYRLVYRLSPQVARLGEVTQHFDAMQVTLESDGSATVQAQVDNLFFAVRTLLHYGPNCQVLGGPEALREIQKIVLKMYAHYAATQQGAPG